jgi:hypothetical protein
MPVFRRVENIALLNNSLVYVAKEANKNPTYTLLIS